MAPLLLHGGVIPWLFALLPSMPTWFGAVQGPQFLSIALTSAISGVILLSFAFRRAYGWEHIITDDIFRGLLLWLGFFCLLFLWLQLQQLIGGLFTAPVDVTKATEARIHHPAYIIAMTLVFLSLVYIFAQALRPTLFTKQRAAVTGIAVLTGTLMEKILFVAEGLLHPTFDIYHATPGEYFPSLIEFASITGTIGMVGLFFLTVAKVFPVVELHAIEHLRDDHE
jgi:molybdopterin-containing oxidoreductase family membrane subunit